MFAELRIRWLLTCYGFSRWRDRLRMWVAWHAPRWLIHWAVIRCWANATTGENSNVHPDELTWNDALRSWGEV